MSAANTIPFTKMHGTGNDFMVIDNTRAEVELSADQVRAWADRHFGIGFDQMLVVEAASTSEAEFDYRIFNADGGEVEHCGNGARCFAAFVRDKALTDSEVISVNTMAGLLQLKVLDDSRVTVKMGVPEFQPDLIPFVADSEATHYQLSLESSSAGTQSSLEIGAVAIGNPHAVTMVEDVDLADVARIGPIVERHSRFPNAVNVGFMQKIDASNIRLRVFERGVGETRACGTGACAAVAVGVRQKILQRQVRVQVRGGELDIVWPEDGQNIEMTGPCTKVFEGHIEM